MRQRAEGRSLTAVEDPEGDKLDLDNGRDDTHPTSSRGSKVSVLVRESKAAANANTHIEKSLYCRSLTLWPNCKYERDKINEITA